MKEALGPILRLDLEQPVQYVSDVTTYPANDAHVVLALGKAPQEYCETVKVVPKGRTITALRGQAWNVPAFSSKVLFSYSPGIGDIDYAKLVDLLCDTRLAMRFARTGRLDPAIQDYVANGQYRYVDSFVDMWGRIEELYEQTKKPVEVAFDTETIGLDPYAEHVWLLSLQASIEPGYSDVVYFKTKEEQLAARDDFAFMEALANLLQSPKVTLRMANGKFDVHWVREHFGIRVGPCFKFDTTLVGSLLDENRSNGLDVHAKVCTDIGGYSDAFDKTVDKSRMDLVPKADLLPYAAGDTDATLRVAQVMKQDLLADPQLTNFYVNLLHPAARAYEKVEEVGVCVDMEAYKELEAELRTCLEDCVERAKKVVGGRVLVKHLVEGTLNITKASFLTDFMFSPMGLNLKPKMLTEKTQEPSTAIDHLLMFEDVPEAQEFIGILKDYQSASKTLSTYVVGFQKHLRRDGRFHPSYFLHRGNKDEGEGGTNTGRLSVKDPASQTIPKHTKWAKKLRKVFVALPGMAILSFDYSQGELRVIACIANEPTMIEAYRQNMDLHAITAGRFRGYTYEQMKELKKTDPDLFAAIRQLGKAGNFGLIYGMGEGGFQMYAKLNYGVDLSMPEVAEFRNGFFDTYARLPEYHREYKAFARKHGFVRGPLGRVRHLPLIKSSRNDVSSKAERQAINSPVQGTLSDMSLLFSAEYDRRGYNDFAPLFGQVHDQVLMYCPEDRVLEHGKTVKELAQNLPFDKFGWHPQLTFVADVSYGPNLAEQAEMK